MKTAFVTDSGTGKTIEALTAKGIFSVPLQISFDNVNRNDLENITLPEVFDLIRQEKMLTTSLPSLGRITALFEQLKADGYEQIFAVPICNGLSGTISAMEMIAAQVGIVFDYLDCYVTAVVQEYLIENAKRMHEAGIALSAIKEKLAAVVKTTDTLLLPNDLQHLKRGGRLTPLAVALGGLLKIKPILKINQETNGKIDVVGKVRTMHRAMDEAINIMKQEGVDDSYWITVAHADDEAEAKVLQEKLKTAFPNAQHSLIPLVSVVSIHTGRGCQAIQYFKKL